MGFLFEQKGTRSKIMKSYCPACFYINILSESSSKPGSKEATTNLCTGLWRGGFALQEGTMGVGGKIETKQE